MADALVPCSALRLVAQPLSVPSRKWVLWDGDDAASFACILLYFLFHSVVLLVAGCLYLDAMLIQSFLC